MVPSLELKLALRAAKEAGKILIKSGKMDTIASNTFLYHWLVHVSKKS